MYQSPQRSSRLSRNAEKQSRKQLIFSLVGIAVIIFLIARYGVVALETLSSVINGNSSETQAADNSFTFDVVQPPVLRNVPKAVKDNNIEIKGTTYVSEGTAELFVNNKSQKKVKVKDNEFTFESVRLQEGENVLKVRHIVGDKTSDFSRDHRIVFAKNPPKIELSSPSDGQVFNRGDQEIQVSGKTEAQNKITVNGFFATVDGVGNFSYHLKLNDGENIIKIEAENPAGLKTTQELKVVYQP